MLFKVSNTEEDIEKLLFSLRESYGDYAFVSYIDGEYGIRVTVYNSLVYKFYNEMKEKKIICFGISFKGTTTFLENLCDHIIEIDDIEFSSNIMEPIEDNCQTSENHINNVVPSNSYEGNDGWDLTYIRGIHSKKYEDILLKMNFKNLFYTLHLDGARYINSHGCNKGIIYKINNENVIFNVIHNQFCADNSVIRNKNIKDKKTNNIAIWIRNTNKWPHRNTPEDVYKTLFDFCINNDKKCYVFQDLNPVLLPSHENIIDSTDRFKNRPNFDKFLEICNNIDIYVGADSGSTLALVYSDINALILCSGHLLWPEHKNIVNFVNTGELLVQSIKNYYEIE
jgi:hypothetical protein